MDMTRVYVVVELSKARRAMLEVLNVEFSWEVSAVDEICARVKMLAADADAPTRWEVRMEMNRLLDELIERKTYWNRAERLMKLHVTGFLKHGRYLAATAMPEKAKPWEVLVDRVLVGMLRELGDAKGNFICLSKGVTHFLYYHAGKAEVPDEECCSELLANLLFDPLWKQMEKDKVEDSFVQVHKVCTKGKYIKYKYEATPLEELF